VPTTKSKPKGVAEKTAGGIDPALLKAMADPVRCFALTLLNERVASPKEIANELNIEVGAAAYHVKVLRKLDCIELVDTKQRRGATEHYYRATKRAFFNDEEWAAIPLSVRGKIVTDQHLRTNQLLKASVESGTFEERGNRNHSLFELNVDEQGWNDVMAELEAVVGRLVEIQGESAERRIHSDEPSIPTAVSLIGFEKAPAKDS